MRHRATLTFCLILTVVWLSSAVDAQISGSDRRREESDIAKLAAITRLDHSTMFFVGYTVSGYVRDGSFHQVVLRDAVEPGNLRCRGRAVSRDGTRIAYVIGTDDQQRCQILLRDLRTGEDRRLAEVQESFRPLSWSWNDAEIAYQRRGGVFAVSTEDGRERILARLPLRVDGRKPVRGGQLVSVDWLHQRSELVADAMICLPTRQPEDCRETKHTLMLTMEDSRVLVLGGGAAVSPARDQIGFVTEEHIEVIDADESHRRRLTVVRSPWFCFFCIAESTFASYVVWSPSGDRLWFETVTGEAFDGHSYLVGIKSGRRERVLENSSITVVAWR